MKQGHPRCVSFRYLIILFCTSFIFYSCHTYNFSHPQPAGKENIEEFPKDFRGNWISEEGDEMIYIGKRHANLTRKDGMQKIVKGAWPKIDDTGAFVFNNPYYYRSFQIINYDSLRRPVDTSTNFMVRGNYIYGMDGKGLLGSGYPYRVDNDTIIMIKNDTFTLDLGRNAFLRKLNNQFYVLNISNSILGGFLDGENSNWWQVLILEKKDKQLINLWSCEDKITLNPSMFYDHDGNYYFDSEWTAEEMLQLIKDGNFSDGDKLTRAGK